MEYPGHADAPRKRLTKSDVDRLAVPTKWAAFMPPAQPDRNIPIRVLDDLGHVYEFYLSVRRNGYPKPVFQAREWKRFIQYRGAKVDDEIYFRYEVNELMQTQYRMVLLRDYFRPSPPGL